MGRGVGCMESTALIEGIMELSLLRTLAPGSESTMVWNFRSLELSFPGTFAPWNFRSWERKFQELSLPCQVTFGRDIRSWICIGLCICGCIRILGLMALYIRRLPHNRHFQHTTLVSLTVIFSPACSAKVVINLVSLLFRLL